jgi:hypothetical protein
MRTGRDGKR